MSGAGSFFICGSSMPTELAATPPDAGQDGRLSTYVVTYINDYFDKTPQLWSYSYACIIHGI